MKTVDKKIRSHIQTTQPVSKMMSKDIRCSRGTISYKGGIRIEGNKMKIGSYVFPQVSG
jgi:hypothetical protein